MHMHGENDVPHESDALTGQLMQAEPYANKGVDGEPEQDGKERSIQAGNGLELAQSFLGQQREKNGPRWREFGPRQEPSEAQVNAEQKRREMLQHQARCLMSGMPVPQSTEAVPVVNGTAIQKSEMTPEEAMKVLGLSRRGVRMRPVISGFTPHKTAQPKVFPYSDRQRLTRLSRTVSRDWVAVLTSVSTTSVAGGKLNGSQGRNLVRIVEELRKHCFLRIDDQGQPTEVREQVVQVVGGERFCFARQCGMSEATFYRALTHPLAHLFVRTQKVQRIDGETQARRNVATLFSVALYEPELPAQLENAYWAEPVPLAQEFVVPDFTSQDDSRKGRPGPTQIQKDACGKLTSRLGSVHWQETSQEGRDRFLAWIDGAGLMSRAEKAQSVIDRVEDGIKGCIDNLRNRNPGLWELAAQIAIHHDEPTSHAVAAIGYYKALIHLGVEKVRYWVQRMERWQLKGQRIETPGRLLMHLLNKDARAATGFEIRDLGTETGQYVS